MAEIEEELKSLWMRVKEESYLKKKNWLKTQHSKKLRLWHLVPITSWQIEGENILFSWASKSLGMVTAATRLKDACSLEGNL